MEIDLCLVKRGKPLRSKHYRSLFVLKVKGQSEMEAFALFHNPATYHLPVGY